MKKAEWGWMAWLILVPIWGSIALYLSTVVPEGVLSGIRRGFISAWASLMVVLLLLFAYLEPRLWIKIPFVAVGLLTLFMFKNRDVALS